VVNQFSAHFTALNGVLTADSVKAVAEGRAVSVTGTIDVDKSALDLLISVAKKPAAATAADPTGTFKVQGPWATPSISPAEPGKAAQTKVSGADPGG
jgi:AsmA protein